MRQIGPEAARRQPVNEGLNPGKARPPSPRELWNIESHQARRRGPYSVTGRPYGIQLRRPPRLQVDEQVPPAIEAHGNVRVLKLEHPAVLHDQVQMLAARWGRVFGKLAAGSSHSLDDLRPRRFIRVNQHIRTESNPLAIG
jgi:hypothetical protein